MVCLAQHISEPIFLPFSATSGPLITALDDDTISHARPVIRFPEESVPSSQPIVSSPVSTSAGKGCPLDIKTPCIQSPECLSTPLSDN